MRILQRQDGKWGERLEGAWQDVESPKFGRESELEEFLHTHPQVIPWRLDPKDLCILRQFRFESDFTHTVKADLVALDRRGNLGIVEVKLNGNQDRRSVVAQVFDYAAHLLHWEPQRVLNIFEERLGRDPLDAWCKTDQERHGYIQALQRNLRDGHVSIVVAMDRIPEETRFALATLTQATKFQVGWLEAQRVRSQGVEWVVVDSPEPPSPVEVAVTERRREQGSLSTEDFLKSIPEPLKASANAFVEVWASPRFEAWRSSSPGQVRLIVRPHNRLNWTEFSDHASIWCSGDVAKTLRAHLEPYFAQNGVQARWRAGEIPPDKNKLRLCEFDPVNLDVSGWTGLLEHYFAFPPWHTLTTPAAFTLETKP